ncbi:PAS domain S-box protein [Tateyamaria omphalii]|uniref:PAS domain-containing sensor histidine kinase n=1 Tax=Tateyamaria omphalii TaxID=299262 RepID=UPI001C996FA9|nr:PAS domain-containing sensor histidine kinase [Tateyamaria omphalii]MBY5932739.1 PAS domain S-box protein [Tateyamaria omphalii]
MDQLSTKLLDTVPVPILVVSEDGTISFANASARSLTGFPAKNLHGNSIIDHIATGDETPVLDLLDRAEDRFVIERVLVRQTSGQTVPALLNVERWSENGKVLYTIAVRDLTSQQQREDEHLAVFARLDHAVRGANIGVFEVDVVNQKSIVSDTWKELMGLEPDEDIDFQAEWESRVHPEDLPRTQQADAECIANPNTSTLSEYRVKNRSGTGWRWMMSDAIGIDRDQSGQAKKIIGAQTDVTDRKNAEEALRSSERQLRSLIEESPVGKGTVNLEGLYVQANKALCQFVGYEDHELIGQPAGDIIHPDDLPEDIRQATELLSGTQSVYSREKRYIRKDGAFVWGLVTVKLVRDVLGEPKHFITQVFDITERRFLQEMKKDFVATVSHELRTPVTSILAALDLLVPDIPADAPETTHRLLSIMRLNGDRLNALINDILTMQKLSAGEMAVHLQSVDMTHLVRQAAELNQPYVDKCNVTYSFDLPEQEMLCRTDPARFQQIAANLISNAAKFSDPEGRVELIVAEAQDRIRFTVRDHGQGLSEHQQHHIFEPFAQFETPSPTMQVGTGLGLSITKRLVEIQGGAISVQSTPGQGSAFSVEFRRTTSHDATTPA